MDLSEEAFISSLSTDVTWCLVEQSGVRGSYKVCGKRLKRVQIEYTSNEHFLNNKTSCSLGWGLWLNEQNRHYL